MIDTQIETIETLNGMQNIEADNVTINYYSDSNDYEEALAQIVSDVKKAHLLISLFLILNQLFPLATAYYYSSDRSFCLSSPHLY